MKVQMILILFCWPYWIYGQKIEYSMSGDTLTIIDLNISNDPFEFGNNPLDYLNKLNSLKSYKTFNNRHVDNVIDTSFIFSFGSDTFEVYKWSERENGLLIANVVNNHFKTKHGLQIGMSKNEIIQKLKLYKLESIPNYLIFEDLEVYELLIFKFVDDRLAKIQFQGYID